MHAEQCDSLALITGDPTGRPIWSPIIQGIKKPWSGSPRGLSGRSVSVARENKEYGGVHSAEQVSKKPESRKGNGGMGNG